MRTLHLVMMAFLTISPRHLLPDRAPTSYELCRIEQDGRGAGASADVCARIARRWQTLTGSRPIRGTIRIVDGPTTHSTASVGEWTLEWLAPSTAHSPAIKRRADGFTAHEVDNIITHEAGHVLFKSYTVYLDAPWDGERYSSVLPDWFDESPAVWMESAQLREQRMRPVIGTTPSLTKLVTMSHPARESVRDNALNKEFHARTRTVVAPCPQCTFLPDSVRRKYRITEIGVDANGRLDTVVRYSTANPNKGNSLEEKEFYPLCYSLLRFIHQRGGAAAVRELISRYRVDPRPRVEILSGLPGLPASVKAVEAEWHTFLKKPPPEDG